MGSLLVWVFQTSNGLHCNFFPRPGRNIGAEPPENFWNHAISSQKIDISRALKKGTFVLFLKRAGAQTPIAAHQNFHAGV